MSQPDTAILAVYAEKSGLAKSAESAATILRSANNAALKARYNDKLVRLSAVSHDIAVAEAQISTGITTAGYKNASATKAYILRIAETFHYQCSEGNCDIVPGYKLLNAIIASLQK